jgi:DNA-binding transcriptional LysR family regulator
MEQDMHYIYQLYLDGSFTAAAEHLYMSQPALSLAVKRVEDNVGAELFDRSRRPLVLTEAGRAYIETIRNVRQLEEDLARQIEDLRNLDTGKLTLGGTHFLNSYILAPILSSFSKTYPGIQLELVEDSAVNLEKSLEKRDLDLTFSCAPAFVERFEHKPAFTDRVLLAVHKNVPLPPEIEALALSPGDILAGRHHAPDCPQTTLAPFRDIDFILLQKGNNLHDRSRAMFAEAGFEPKIKMTISQMVTSYRLADNDLGAAIISDRLVRSKRSNLRFFKLDSSEAVRRFYFLLPRRNYTPFSVRAFMKFALAQLS